jgi:hypothetical protein
MTSAVRWQKRTEPFRLEDNDMPQIEKHGAKNHDERMHVRQSLSLDVLDRSIEAVWMEQPSFLLHRRKLFAQEVTST